MPPSLTWTPKSQWLTSSNSVDTSPTVIQIVPLNMVKDGGMIWFGFRKKAVCYNSCNSDGSSEPWILNGLLSSFSTNVAISQNKSGMAMDIHFKLRVEATQRNR